MQNILIFHHQKEALILKAQDQLDAQKHKLTSATSSSPTAPNGTIVAPNRAAILTNSCWSGQNNLYSSPQQYKSTITVGIKFRHIYIHTHIHIDINIQIQPLLNKNKDLGQQGPLITFKSSLNDRLLTQTKVEGQISVTDISTLHITLVNHGNNRVYIR